MPAGISEANGSTCTSLSVNQSSAAPANGAQTMRCRNVRAPASLTSAGAASATKLMTPTAATTMALSATATVSPASRVTIGLVPRLAAPSSPRSRSRSGRISRKAASPLKSSHGASLNTMASPFCTSEPLCHMKSSSEYSRLAAISSALAELHVKLTTRPAMMMAIGEKLRPRASPKTASVVSAPPAIATHSRPCSSSHGA